MLKNQKGFIHLGVLGLLLLVGALAVGAKLASDPNFIFNINEKAAEWGFGHAQTVTGTLVKAGTSNYGPCNSTSKKGNYGIVTGNQGPEVGPRGPEGFTPGKCLPMVTSATNAESLVGKKVIATGIFRSNVFYATSLKEVSNLETTPGGKAPKVAATPTPTPTPCPGLKTKSVCDPKATSANQKCCSPLTCQGTWNNKTAKYENYSCADGSIQRAL